MAFPTTFTRADEKMAMGMNKTLLVTDREQWRRWLEQNHTREREVWLIFKKIHTGQPSIPYEDSVEEALCFGWIDSLIQRIDEDRYARKFTPRKPGSKWSQLNKRRVAKMIESGRMKEAGLALVDFPLTDAKSPPVPHPMPDLPDWLASALKANPMAWENFNKLPPSHRRNYIGWISDAKREETRQRRIQEALGLLAKNERLGLK